MSARGRPHGLIAAALAGAALLAPAAAQAGTVQVNGDALEITAAPFVAAGSSVLAVLPAGRRRLVWAVYGPDQETQMPRNTTLDELLSYLMSSPNLVVAGELFPDQRAAIAASHRNVLSSAAGARRPGVLAELAWNRWTEGEIDDPSTVEPLYLHGKPMGGSTGG